jgi:hypothetical protein
MAADSPDPSGPGPRATKRLAVGCATGAGVGAGVGRPPLPFGQADMSIQAWPMPITGSLPIIMWAFES